MSTLRVESISKRYRRRWVVSDVSMGLDAGEIVGLLGPNGAGKTTTFKIVMGAVRPDSGRVVLSGTEVTRLTMHRRAKLGLGYLAQEPSVFRRLSVEANLRLALEATGYPRRHRQERIAELARELGVERLIKQEAGTLSGGERRRVEIARLLATDPKLVLFDEPFTGIDPITIEELQKIMLTLKRRKIGILITDHRVAETLRLVDRAYILNDGTLLKEGTAEAIAQDERVRRLYLGESFTL